MKIASVLFLIALFAVQGTIPFLLVHAKGGTPLDLEMLMVMFAAGISLVGMVMTGFIKVIIRDLEMAQGWRNTWKEKADALTGFIAEIEPLSAARHVLEIKAMAYNAADMAQVDLFRRRNIEYGKALKGEDPIAWHQAVSVAFEQEARMREAEVLGEKKAFWDFVNSTKAVNGILKDSLGDTGPMFSVPEKSYKECFPKESGSEAAV